MSPREVLEKMRGWIEAEQVKAQLPYADPFVLISISFCAEKAVGGAEAQDILALLHSVAKEERMPTYDVVTPAGALFIINRALATQT